MKAFTSRSLSMALACLVAVLAGPGFALAKTEIQLWHGMTGVLGETLEAQAKQFNDSQDEFEVKPVSKGSEAKRSRRRWRPTSRRTRPTLCTSPRRPPRP